MSKEKDIADEAMKEMTKALETELFYGGGGNAKFTANEKLKHLLYKLGIKSASPLTLKIESFDRMFKKVTFQMNNLKLWDDKK